VRVKRVWQRLISLNNDFEGRSAAGLSVGDVAVTATGSSTDPALKIHSAAVQDDGT
jgi:hypothetical protein